MFNGVTKGYKPWLNFGVAAGGAYLYYNTEAQRVCPGKSQQARVETKINYQKSIIMATLKQGILGGFSGKVGTVIGFVRNGVACIRGLMTSHTDANTPAQQEQRARFALVMKFLHPILGIIRAGFKSASATMSNFNAAVAYTLENGIKGIYPLLEIDYTKVLVCRGNLPGALNAVAVSVLAGKIDFTWDNNAWDFGAEPTDKVVLVVYCPVLNKSVTAIGAATRMQGAQTMTLPDLFSGQQVQTFIGFCNEGESEFSNGEFLSSVIVA